MFQSSPINFSLLMLLLAGMFRRLIFSFIIFNLILDGKCRRLIFSLIIFNLILDGKWRRLICDDPIGQRLQRYRRWWWLWSRSTSFATGRFFAS